MCNINLVLLSVLWQVLGTGSVARSIKRLPHMCENLSLASQNSGKELGIETHAFPFHAWKTEAGSCQGLLDKAPWTYLWNPKHIVFCEKFWQKKEGI